MLSVMQRKLTKRPGKKHLPLTIVSKLLKGEVRCTLKDILDHTLFLHRSMTSWQGVREVV
jgi:hypothetical protein